MFDRSRIARLKALIRRLEGLPPSAARDDALRTARHRVVALETGDAMPAPSRWDPEHGRAAMRTSDPFAELL